MVLAKVTLLRRFPPRRRLASEPFNPWLLDLFRLYGA
jgi:hypothetical protein